MNTNNHLYNWEFNGSQQRGTLWYTLALSLVLGLVVWWFLTQQYALSFVIILITGLFYYLENNSSDTIQVNITSLWISVEKQFYDYWNIASYTLIYSHKNAVYLRLNLSKKWIKHVDLHIDNEIAEHINSLLPQYIPENGQKDLTFTEKLIHWLKL